MPQVIFISEESKRGRDTRHQLLYCASYSSSTSFMSSQFHFRLTFPQYDSWLSFNGHSAIVASTTIEIDACQSPARCTSRRFYVQCRGLFVYLRL